MKELSLILLGKYLHVTQCFLRKKSVFQGLQSNQNFFVVTLLPLHCTTYFFLNFILFYFMRDRRGQVFDLRSSSL